MVNGKNVSNFSVCIGNQFYNFGKNNLPFDVNYSNGIGEIIFADYNAQNNFHDWLGVFVKNKMFPALLDVQFDISFDDIRSWQTNTLNNCVITHTGGFQPNQKIDTISYI